MGAIGGTSVLLGICRCGRSPCERVPDRLLSDWHLDQRCWYAQFCCAANETPQTTRALSPQRGTLALAKCLITKAHWFENGTIVCR
jgi:hypothetical protein